MRRNSRNSRWMVLTITGFAFWLMALQVQALRAQDAAESKFPVQRIDTSEPEGAEFFASHEESTGKVVHTSAVLDTGIVKMSRRLANLDWQKFEQKLVELWGNDIQASAEDAEGSRIRIVIPGNDVGKNQMVIDRRYNAVTFEGDPQVAQTWSTLIDLLDRVDEEANVRLVGLGDATGETVRQAIGLLGIPEADSATLSAALEPASIYTNESAGVSGSPDGRLRAIPFRPATETSRDDNAGEKSAANPTEFRSSPTELTPQRGSSFIPDDQHPGKNLSDNQPFGSTAQTGRSTIPVKNSSLGKGGIEVGGSQFASSPKLLGQPITSNTGNPLKPVATSRKLVYSAPRKQQEEGPRGMNIVELQQDPVEGPAGTVKIRVVDELNAIVLIGDPEDVKKVKEMILNIVSTAGESQPISKLYPVKFADSATLKATIDQIYETAYLDNNGVAEIVAITTPNSLMVVGQETAQSIIADLVAKLDIETPDTDETLDFRVFRLKHMSAVDAGTQLSGYFRPSQGETDFQEIQAGNWIASVAGLVSIIIDYRSNSVIVKGNQSVLRNAERILSELDIDTSDTAHVVRFFKVYNTLAVDIASILQNAINGQLEGAPQELTNGQNQQFGAQNNAAGGFGTQNRANLPVSMLKMTTIDKDGAVTKSGILLSVKVTADANSNQLIVTGPENSMDLIEALVKQLDQIPDAETQIKVFTITNGDANELLTTLQTIFGSDQAQTGVAGGQSTNGNLPLQTASATAGASLINLRFGVDARTNSIIASGPAGDLQLIESILNRLDEQDVTNRINQVYKLSNAPAEDVALAINNWLDGRQEVFDADPTTNAEYVSARRQVVVVEELISNSLIISATPAYFDEVMELIEALDRRPPMVKIKVMLAQVRLDKLTEFGVEVGIQDSLLFDRGLGVIGFPFNQAGIGNNADALSLSTREFLAGQALSSLKVGRENTNLGYGGMVLSAGSESINVLLRALQNREVARVLSTPDIMTVENLQGRVQVGQKVPRIIGAGQTQFGGIFNEVADEDVGVILSVTPRVSPDGMIIMAVDAVNSKLGSEADGVPVFVSEGQIVRSPPIDIIQAQTTVMARSGQTVAFSGLIQDSVTQQKRGTPILSDLPVIGPLFTFESDEHERDELLIILTPYLVDNEAQLEASNQAAMSRMNWCLADVADVYGSGIGYDGFDPENLESIQTPTYFPDEDPTGQQPQYLPLESDGAVPAQSPEGAFNDAKVIDKVSTTEDRTDQESEKVESVSLLQRLIPRNNK